MVQAGAEIVEILYSGQSPLTGSATLPELEAWVERGNGLTISTVIDAEGADPTSLATLQVRETILIVALPSMQVVYLDRGDVSGRNPSSIEPAMARARELLP